MSTLNVCLRNSGKFWIALILVMALVGALVGCAQQPTATPATAPQAAPTAAPPAAVPTTAPPAAPSPAAAAPTKPAAKTGKVLMQFPTLENQYWQDLDAGASQAAKALGLEYVKQSYDGSIEKMLSQIENAGALNINMIVTCSMDSESTRKMFTPAAKQKIFVVAEHNTAAWSTPLDPEYEGYYATFVIPDNVQGSKAMAVSVFKQIGGKGKVIHLTGMPGNTSADERTLGVDLALKEFPDIQLVARQNGGEQRTTAQPVIENLLTAHPDVKAVVCHNDDEAIATLNALRDRGMTDVKVGGYDAIPEFLDAMQKGTQAVATTAIHGAWMGGWCVVSAFDAFNGVKVDPVERMLYFDSLVIDTPEAAKAYSENIYKAQQLPFDWKGMSRFYNPDSWDPQNGFAPLDPVSHFERTKQNKPAGFTGLPKVLQESIDAGNLKKYVDVYKAHFKGGPILDVVKLTTAKKTVLGFN